MSFDALDSAQPPSDAQVQQAKTAGYGGWWGYIATQGWGGSAFNLLHVWTLTDFDRVRPLNPHPVAFCSGLDDPVALKAIAAQWNVRLCLDDESGIRAPGGWEQAFLDASGAGLYGNCGLHAGLSAAFHILAWYGVGSGTWYSGCLHPPGHVGWQWQGSHQEFGIDVDRGSYEDWFGQVVLTPDDITAVKDAVVTSPQFDDLANRVVTLLANSATQGAGPSAGAPNNLKAELDAIRSNPATVDVTALATALAPILAPLLPPETDPQVIAQASAQATMALVKAQWAK